MLLQYVQTIRADTKMLNVLLYVLDVCLPIAAQIKGQVVQWKMFRMSASVPISEEQIL